MAGPLQGDGEMRERQVPGCGPGLWGASGKGTGGLGSRVRCPLHRAHGARICAEKVGFAAGLRARRREEFA